jgi:hypothetical protein
MHPHSASLVVLAFIYAHMPMVGNPINTHPERNATTNDLMEMGIGMPGAARYHTHAVSASPPVNYHAQRAISKCFFFGPFRRGGMTTRHVRVDACVLYV